MGAYEGHMRMDAKVVDEVYFSAAEGISGACALHALDRGMMVTSVIRRMTDDPCNRVMICVLELDDGRMLVGSYTCASLQTYSAEASRSQAKEDALSRLRA